MGGTACCLYAVAFVKWRDYLFQHHDIYLLPVNQWGNLDIACWKNYTLKLRHQTLNSNLKDMISIKPRLSSHCYLRETRHPLTFQRPASIATNLKVSRHSVGLFHMLRWLTRSESCAVLSFLSLYRSVRYSLRPRVSRVNFISSSITSTMRS